MTEYQTAARRAEAEFLERRSRFIGCAKPVENEKEALRFLEAVRSARWDATHHVYAYTLWSGGIRRFSDDGEPQGTAGMPVLDVLLKSGVTDTVLVVTRYFGGILLGAGGLVRAYSRTASLALEQAGVAVMRACVVAQVTCPYAHYGRLAALIPECGGAADHADFTDSVTVRFHMAREQWERFRAMWADVTGGRCAPVPLGEKYFKF